jgi:4-aminobutyrate aminotransferase
MLLHAELTGTELPEIRTAVPGPRSRELTERLRAHESPAASGIAAGQVPVFWEQSRGAVVVDADGNRFVDLTAAFCVAVAGHSNPRIVDAVSRQASQLFHSQGIVNPNPRRVELIEKLASLAPGDLSVAHLVNTGSEAIELALLTARLATGKQTVIAFHGGFHGKIGGALGVTSMKRLREPFASVLPGFHHVPFPDVYRSPFPRAQGDVAEMCIDYLDRVLGHPDSGVLSVAAVILEPVQGGGGWIVPPPGFLRQVRDLCTKYGVLMICDEVITGFGRTGAWFASNHDGVVPDILACGKGMSSGFPIAGVVTRPDIANHWQANMRSSTYLGNPVGSAAALACIAELEDHNLVERSRVEGAYFKDRLDQLRDRHPLIGDVRGQGMMVAIELVRDRQTKEPASAEGKRVVDELLQRGVMATNYGGSFNNVIKMSPPLVIAREQLDYAIDAIDQSLSAVEASL